MSVAWSASTLAGYPIAVSFSAVQPSGAVRRGRIPIQPLKTWRDCGDWSPELARHNLISMADLLLFGMEVDLVAARLNAELCPFVVTGTQPARDAEGLRMLFEAAGVARGFRFQTNPAAEGERA